MSYPVEVWVDANYQGLSAKLDYRTYWNIIQTGLPNDSISSLKVGAFTKVVLYDDISLQGQSITVMGPREIPSLSNYPGSMNDRISSIQVIRVEPDIVTKMQCCQGIQTGLSCGEFSAENGAICNNVMTEYCATRMGEPVCQSWCKAHPAQCDSMVLTYCAAHPEDPYCACVNSPAAVSGAINPKCVDRKCLNTGYLTSAMIGSNCPNIVTCEVKNYLTNSGVILSNTIPVQQNCGGAGAQVPTNTTTTDQQPGAQTDTGPGPELIMGWPKTYILYFLIFLLIIFAAVVGISIISDWVG